MSKAPEPKEAFPYKPPSQQIKDKYRHIFALKAPLPERLPKLIFDKFVAVVALLFAFPILLLLRIAYLIEGLIIPANRGPMFFLLCDECGKADSQVQNSSH